MVDLSTQYVFPVFRLCAHQRRKREIIFSNHRTCAKSSNPAAFERIQFMKYFGGERMICLLLSFPHLFKRVYQAICGDIMGVDPSFIRQFRLNFLGQLFAEFNTPLVK
jgi:hypothetical protein